MTKSAGRSEMKILIEESVLRQALEAFDRQPYTMDAPVCESLRVLRTALDAADKADPVAFGKSDDIRHLAENIMTDCGVASTYYNLRKKIEDRLWDYFDTNTKAVVTRTGLTNSYTWRTEMLSDRIRPNSEAAPWVIEEVKALEQHITELEACIKSHGNQPDSEALKLARECGFAEWHGTDDVEFLKVIEAFYRAAFNAGLEAAIRDTYLCAAGDHIARRLHELKMKP